MLNKYGAGKKRVIYMFPPEESAVLKLLAFLLYRYDAARPPNCSSFRKNIGPKKAIHTLVSAGNIAEKYACKIDIKNYFNSIDVDLLLLILRDILWDDLPLCTFLKNCLQWIERFAMTSKSSKSAARWPEPRFRSSLPTFI